MRFEELKNLTSSIQSLVISVGLVCTGFWALFVFDYQNNEALNISLTASHISDPSEDFVVINFVAKNEGSKIKEMNFGENALLATLVRFDENGRLVYTGESIESNFSEFEPPNTHVLMGNVKLYPKSTKNLISIFKPKSKGTYFIQLSAIDDEDSAIWAAHTYVQVK